MNAALLLSLSVLGAPNLPSSTDGSVAKTRRYAIVIGVNKPMNADQRPLRYADDDAVRFYELFREISGEASLFALLDEETQRLYPEVVQNAELPKKELLFRGIDRVLERIKSDRARGLHPELYLVYSGHGHVDDRGEGQLSLLDGTFSRSELYEHVLARSEATANHVIVDACDAYFFVQARGNDDQDLEALLHARANEFLDRQTLASYPNTGAVLSTASAAETHEWSEIGSGVFSHEVRSALLGGADANQDGAISYDELEAFVLAANAGVVHARASRAIFVRPPLRDRAHPVLELDALPRASRLHLGPSLYGKIAIADDEGRRYADLHKADGFGLSLTLLPGVRYFVRMGNDEYSVPAGEHDVELAMLEAHPPATTARGAGIEEAYQKGLFALPFGPQLVEGFRLRSEAQSVSMVQAPSDSPLPTIGLVTGGATLVAAGTAIAFFLAGESAKADYDATPDTDLDRRQSLDDDVRAWDSRTNVAIGAAVGLGLTTATVFLIDALAGDGE